MRFESCVISKAVYICQVLREGAISAVKPKSLRERAYIGGERGRNMSVG